VEAVLTYFAGWFSFFLFFLWAMEDASYFISGLCLCDVLAL